MSDPLDLFAAGPSDRATELFVDRVSYSAGFADSVGAHLDRRDRFELGFREPRRNLIVFYGTPGIGKSQLLIRLRRWVTEGGQVPAEWGQRPLAGQTIATTACVLDDGLDVDSVLLALRATAERFGIPTPAFDVGLLARWETSRPGEAVPTSIDPNPRIGPIPLDGLVKGSVGATLGALGLGFASGWIGGLTARLAKSKVVGRAKHRTIEDCRPLAAVLTALEEQGGDQVAAAVAGLLNWDLELWVRATRTDRSRALWVAFLDTLEAVQGEDARAEELVQRIIYATPQILWVVGGRDRLSWAEPPAGRLKYSRPELWPDVDQQLVGGLSDQDAERFLSQALADTSGKPQLPADCRLAIIAHAQGLPHYLDLAVDRARDILRAGDPLVPKRFDVPFQQLAGEVARHLPEGERIALNGAALARTVDLELIAVGARVDREVTERLARRSLLLPADPARGLFSLPESLRPAIREMPAAERGGWADATWHEAGERMLADLDRRRRAAATADERLEHALTGLDIADDLALEIPWIRAAMTQHPDRAHVAAVLAGRPPRDASPSPWTCGLRRFFACWLDGGSDDDREQRLARLADDASLRPDVLRLTLRSRAYRLRTLARHGEAAEVLEELLDRLSPKPPLERYQHALTLVHLGCFSRADLLRQELERDGARSEAARLLGEVRFHHGDVETAVKMARERREQVARRSDDRNAMELQVAEAVRAALLSPSNLPLADRAHELAAEHRALGHVRSALCARAICLAGDHKAVDAALLDSAEVGRRAREPEPTGLEMTARALDAAVRGDVEMMRALRLVGRSADTRWCRPILWWRDWLLEESPRSFPHVEWLESEEHVRARWVELARRRRVSAPAPA